MKESNVKLSAQCSNIQENIDQLTQELQTRAEQIEENMDLI